MRWPADEPLNLLLVLRQGREVGSPKAQVTESPPRELLTSPGTGPTCQEARNPGLGWEAGLGAEGLVLSQTLGTNHSLCLVLWEETRLGGLTLRDLIPAWRGPLLLMGTLQVHPQRYE